ncbi:hypothetical protein JNUCC1_02252 [Lentibacillus sp. JNUCC-1]|uniref:hypothetical protein n=1 Tax=Lentibacillus sp. JNUCC-1 TaxID=2654513 RepID=UPI0012E8258D|nr:hypothetical protein [Lentibacillus sp. JNUCC-1]MUV38164.1 hypothetical protein [Lentibacillus sp. JNUCC-1]MUV38414.1 hypothetical protein [Lentibacillus sp. JNUCC-1]
MPRTTTILTEGANDDVDEALEEARRETDPDTRKKLYKEAQEILIDVAPMIYIHHQEYLLGVDDSVKDFDIDAQGIYQIHETYID